MKDSDTLPSYDPCRLLFWITGERRCFQGETDQDLCGQSCLNSGTPNQSSPSPLSLSLSLCLSLFLSLTLSVYLCLSLCVSHCSLTPSPHRDGGHVWSRAENGQSGCSHSHYYDCSSYLLSLSLLAPYRTAILPRSLHLYLSGTAVGLLFLTGNIRDYN